MRMVRHERPGSPGGARARRARAKGRDGMRSVLPRCGEAALHVKCLFRPTLDADTRLYMQLINLSTIINITRPKIFISSTQFIARLTALYLSLSSEIPKIHGIFP